MKKIFLIWVLILFSVIIVKGFTHAEDLKTKIDPKSMSKAEVELRSSMRILWETRATLLRSYIVSKMNDSKDANEARDKLLKNAGDLGASIKPYYGGWAGSFLNGFLKKDVMLTEKVIEAAKKVNEKSVGLAEKAKVEAMDVTEKATVEALALTKKATVEALALTKKSGAEAHGLTGKTTEKAMDLTENAKVEALALTDKDKEDTPDLTEKAKGKALGLTEKAKEKALDLTEKAKEKALILTEKGNKEALYMVNKDKDTAMDLIEKAKEIAMDLIKKAKEMALDMTEKAKEKALIRDKKAKEEALKQAKEKWYRNARDLAGFFAIPHNQTKKDLTDMLCKHMDLTWGEIESILKKDEGEDLDYYEKDKAHMVIFSGILTDGIVKQFPKKFKD